MFFWLLAVKYIIASLQYILRKNILVRMSSKCLWLTFRKVSVKDPSLQGKKIVVVLETTHNTYKLKSSRSVKNGIANFYGESFALPLQTGKFTMSVQQETKNQKIKPICQFLVPKDQIQEFTFRKNIFISDSKQLKVTWEGQILDEEQEQQHGEYSDRQQLDFEDLEEKIQQKNQIIHRNAYSPLIRPLQENIYKKKSFRFGNQETASEPPSESPYKFTLDTNHTHNRVVKKKQTLESIKKIQQTSFNYSSDDDGVHSIFKQKKAKKKIQKRHSTGFIKPLLRNQPSNERAQTIKRRILEKVTLKTIVYSGVIGILSGLTGTQF